jgi:hypothetical protein
MFSGKSQRAMMIERGECETAKGQRTQNRTGIHALQGASDSGLQNPLF